MTAYDYAQLRDGVSRAAELMSGRVGHGLPVGRVESCSLSAEAWKTGIPHLAAAC
jgi:hypothetical protein